MKVFFWTTLFVLIMGHQTNQVFAAPDCPRYLAPGKFNNRPPSWQNDSGPIVDGFIDVKRSSAEGGTLDVVHGVDLSHYNSIDVARLRECGGAFAFVQMDSAFARTVDSLKEKSITAIPYSFFSLSKELRSASELPETPSVAEIAQFRSNYSEAGRSAAERFVRTLQEANAREPIPVSNVAGLRGRFIAVDVEQMPLGHFSAKQAQRYGQFYATAICAWLKTVSSQNGMEDVLPILYTFPAIYGQYLSYAYPEENQCLQGLPVWIARTFPNGGEALHDVHATRGTDKFVQRLCRVQAGNRCLIHQYTHRGIFMAARRSKSKIPVHFDLDRFYSSMTVDTGAGAQFVRKEDPFK